MTYYVKGGSRYNAANPKVWTALFLGGYSESIYTETWENLDDKGVESDDDPYWRMGGSSGGGKTAEIGLWNGYRIEIDSVNGIRGWDDSGSTWVDLLAGGVGGNLDDLDDVVISGTPADNEVLAWDNGTSKWINQTAGEAGLATAGHLHDGATLQHDSVNSDGGAFSFTTSGVVTFSQEIKIPELEITSGGSNQIQIYDRDGDADSWIIIYYDKVDNDGLRLAAYKDGAYVTKPLYLYDTSSYQPALYNNFPDGVTFLGNFKVDGSVKAAQCFYDGTTDPDNTNRLNYDGYFYATRVYNAVYNDYADYWKADVGVPKRPGYCYSLNKTGLRITNKRADKACMGICSDTYGHAVGVKQRAIPISVGGFLLAYCDKEYDTGDLLVPNDKGILTLATKKEIIMQKCVAKYMYKETKIKTRGVNVNGRHWVKVI